MSRWVQRLPLYCTRFQIGAALTVVVAKTTTVPAQDGRQSAVETLVALGFTGLEAEVYARATVPGATVVVAPHAPALRRRIAG